MRATKVAIDWHSGLPIFASESFLKATGDEYGWLGGIDESGEIRCILPYTIIRKAIFRMVRFRVETISLGEELAVQEEKSFLNSAVEYFRSIRADMIIPATTNTIFRTFPDGADAAPYGSYVINLSQPEDILWRNIGKITRQNINTAKKNGVTVQTGIEHLDAAYALTLDTFKRSKLPFMNHDAYKRYVLGLAENGKIMIAYYQGVAQSCTLYAFSNYCAYAVYGGNIEGTHQGAMKLVQWESIRLFNNLGVKRFDFVGARINPEKGSKQDALSSFKKRFGATLREGYMWKYSLNPLKYRLYCLAARLRSGGDIVDAERHKLKNSKDLEAAST
jgi:hypothetical protein